MIMWDQWALTSATVIVPAILYILTDRKERRNQAIIDKSESNKKHEENQRKMNAILNDQAYLVPHDHQETRVPHPDPDSPLLLSGIIRRPNGKLYIP